VITVQGRVTAADGAVVAGRPVTFAGSSGATDYTGQATTDPTGAYTVQLRAGIPYTLTIANLAGPPDSLPEAEFVRPASPLTFTGDATFDIQFPRGNKLTVRVQDPAGNPVAGVAVSARFDDGCCPGANAPLTTRSACSPTS
jgi:hypothetical protein